MLRWIESLESRTLLSSSLNVPTDIANLGKDITTIVADAKSAKSALTRQANAVMADLNRLHALTPAVKGKLQADVANSRKGVATQVTTIITTGLREGRRVPAEILRLVLDVSRPARLAADQKALGADLGRLQKIEAPLIANLQTRMTTAQTLLLGDLQPTVNANAGDSPLQNDWSALRGAVNTAATKITGDYTSFNTDLTALVADLNA